MSLPTASRSTTQAKLQNLSPTDQMRDYMNRINPNMGDDEDVIPIRPPSEELVIRTANDVPAVISSAMRTTGFQSPEWNTIDNLPGFQDRNIRGMGRKIFSMFTSTPLEQIKTIANLNGQGPNTTAEVRAVAAWLRDNAEDLGIVDMDFGRAIPGYKPEVREYQKNGIRFQVVRDPMGQYIYAYPDTDSKIKHQQEPDRLGRNVPRLTDSIRESTSSRKLNICKPTLMEQLNWDRALNEAFITESSLSKLIGNEAGGQKLVRWLHKKHKLSNFADLQPQPINQSTYRIMWKEFKRNPDNFVVITASNGVAAIKPYEEMIRARQEAARKKGREYDPGGDSTLKYQVIAFTDDGQQVDPALLQARPAQGEEDDREVDPTVMKARGGKATGKDMQNPDNIFNLLSDQIGALHAVFIATSGVEREKMQSRKQENKPQMEESVAINQIFKRIRPVLKTLGAQALSQINRTAQRYINGGNFEEATKIAQNGARLNKFLISLDTTDDIDAGGPSDNYNDPHKIFKNGIQRAVLKASRCTERFRRI